MWQEWVFSITGIVFLLTLIPTMVNRRAYVPRLTSYPIHLALIVQGVTFASLGMYWTAMLSYLTAACWFFIAVKRGTRK